MQGYPQGMPPAKKGMSTLAIVLIVLGVLFVLGVGTCAVGAFFAAKTVSKVASAFADGGSILTQSPAEVTQALAGPKRDYVGVWTGRNGSTLTIEPDGKLRSSKHSGNTNQNYTMPIAAFQGNDIVIHVIVILTLHVTVPPHKVGDHWEMVMDGETYQR